MIRLTQKEFDERKHQYSRITSPRKGWYEVTCTCPNCGGTGYVNFSSLDNARCWWCNTTGKIREKIQIVSESSKISVEEADRRLEEKKQRNIENNIKLGFKKVDFGIAEWFPFMNIEDRYYYIKKETEKAYLVVFIENMDCTQGYQLEFWIPKKAIIFKEEK